MLGFSSFSQAAFSSTASALAALGYLATTSAQLAAGTVISNGQAGPILPAATATFTVNAFGELDAQATTELVNALASFNIATLADIDAQANTTIPAATASFTAAAFGDVDAQANTTLSGATSTFAASALDFDAQASITTSNVVASSSISDFTSVTGKANITPSGATATFALDIDFDAKANTSIGGSVTATLTAADVEGDGQASGFLSTTAAFLSIYITDFADEDAQARAFMPVAASSITASDFGDVDAKANTDIGGSVTAALAVSAFDDVDAKANTTPSAVTATIANSAFDDVDAQATVIPPSVVLTPAIDLDDPIAVRFDFGQFADSYDRSRVLYIVSYGGSDTVYVKEENRTVYIDKDMQNYTVYITA
jgi:hypothetical protein